MNVKEISIVIAGSIGFIIAGVAINKAAGGNYSKLFNWALKSSIIFMIISLIASLYSDYHRDKLFDFYAFGVQDSTRFIKDYFLVGFNLLFLILLVPLKLIFSWMGMRTELGLEQKVTLFITISLVVSPVFNLIFIYRVLFQGY